MEIKFWMSAVLMGLLTLVTLGNGQGLSVSITTTPPSPPFQAATWIRFACQSTGFLVTYNWTVYCGYNQPPGQPRFVARFTDKTNLGELSLSLRSAATSCADTVVCTTRDFSGNTGQATWTLGTVTGVGFWGSALPIENNSALVADSLGQIGTLYCHSSSNVTNAGRWFSPDGSDITTNFADSFAVEFFSGDGYPSYSSIEVIGGHQFTARDQGAYSCTAPDNNGVDQTAVIWIYPNGYQGALQFSLVGRTAISPLTLNCDTTGLPPTLVRWTKGSSTLLNGPVYQMQQTHTTNFQANYTNKLVINQPLHDADGIYSCTVINGLHDPIQDREVGPIVSFVKLFFGVYSVGAEDSVNCNFDDVSVVLIQWESPQGFVVTRNYTLVFTANDSIHSLQFNCHGYNAFGHLVKELQFKIIVNVPDSTLVAMATSTEPNAILGREYSVTCLAAITANSHALLYSPVPSFNDENGTTISSGSNSVTVQGPVTISSSAREVELVFGLLKTSHAGRYVCRASLDSPALDETLVKEDTFQLNLQLPSPVSITLSPSHPSPYFAGSTVTLTCEAMASSLIDTSINAVFSWTRNGEVISNDNHVTITQASSTTTTHQSILTITQLNHELDTGSYQCSASFEPVSSSFYLSSSLTEESSSFSINIQVQPLLVSVDPTEVTVLDVSPHNVITISCLATDQDNTTVGTKSFTWSKQDTNTLLTTSLQHNGGSVSIINRYPEETISTSMLVTSETQAASYVYTCASTQMTLDNTTLLASGSAGVSVTVKGLTNPVQPSGLSAIVLGFSSARIEWTVPSISYTQETHSVVYGLSQQQLDSSSTAVAGTSDLRAVNQVYSTNLTNLEEGRTYYYRVQSMNTVGRVSQSDIGSFQVEDSPIITSLRVSDPSLPPFAGQTFTLICESVERMNTNGFPTVMWFDAQGVPISSGGLSGPIYISTSQPDGTRVISSLEFRPLKASFSQEYTCEINFSSIGVIKTHSYDLQVIVQTIAVRMRTLSSAFLAAHPQQLTCEIDLGQSGPGIVQPIGDVTYTWTSTFVNGQTNQSISTLALRAVDSGVHTCSVMDSVGNIGNGSIEIEVTGVAAYSPLVGVLSNNTLIVTNNGGLDTIYCISGSTQPEVGRWIAPNGEDFTEAGSHPFIVVQGGTNNPGVLEISLTPQGRFSSSEWLGVYSCVIPDEENVNKIVHIGIHTSTPPAVSILSLEASSSALYPAFFVNCTSTGSVATTVKWFKSGQLLLPGILYEMVQILRDGVTSTYDNLLVVHTPIISERTGEYHCEVSNNITVSTAVRDTILHGVRFSNHGIIELGSTASITCSSDLGVSSIEWLYNGQVIESAEGAEAFLVIELVSDTLHDREYTCRARARFGNEERTFRIQVEADADDLSINISPSQSQPQANQPFSLTCTVFKSTGLSGTPTVKWYDAMGNLLTPAGSNLPGGVSIETDIGNGPTYTSTLSFANLQLSQSEQFTCRSQIMTPAIPGMINTTAEWDLIVTDHPSQTPNVNTTTQPETCTKIFQLLLSTVQDCQNYRFTDQESKINSIINSIVESVNELGFDVCTSCRLLTVNEIVQPMFDCDSSFPLSVLFRAKLTGSGTCEEILTAITNWVSSGRAAITVNFNTLRASQDCIVEIDSVDSQFPQCDAQVPMQAQGGIGLSVGVAVGAIVAILLIVVTAIITAVVCLRRKKKSRRSRFPIESDVNYQNPAFSVGTERNESYGKFAGENTYYYDNGLGQTNSMTPLTRTGFYSHEPPKLPSRDELMDIIDSSDNYIPMHSASAKQGSIFDPAAEKAGNDEQLYAEIPANYNGGGDYENSIAKLAMCSEGEQKKEKEYENSFVRVSN